MACSPAVLSLCDEFRSFWVVARSAPLPEQAALWDERVESRAQGVYDELVYSKALDRNWKARKDRLLGPAFRRYGTRYHAIIKYFGKLPSIIKDQVRRFRRCFPQARLDSPVLVMPSLYVFDGKVGSVNGRYVVAVGADAAAGRRRNMELLLSHELFHLHHLENIGLREADFLTRGRLSTELWLEGMATHATGLLNPSKSEGALLFSPQLGACSDSEVGRFAREFLHVANLKVGAASSQTARARWFSSQKSDRGPERVGYLLGLEVVRRVAASHAFDTMLQWNMEEAHVAVMEALDEIGAARGARD